MEAWEFFNALVVGVALLAAWFIGGHMLLERLKVDDFVAALIVYFGGFAVLLPAFGVAWFGWH